MFRIVCDPLSGSTELPLIEIIRSGSQMFVMCVYRTLGVPLVQNYAAKHLPSTRQTTLNHYE